MITETVTEVATGAVTELVIGRSSVTEGVIEVVIEVVIETITEARRTPGRLNDRRGAPNTLVVSYTIMSLSNGGRHLGPSGPPSVNANQLCDVF